MKRTVGTLLVCASLFGLAGCNDGPDAPLQGYVEQIVSLKASDSDAVQGQIEFSEQVTRIVNQTVCDRYQCGVNNHEVCESRNVCESHEVCSNELSWMDRLPSLISSAVASDDISDDPSSQVPESDGRRPPPPHRPVNPPPRPPFRRPPPPPIRPRPPVCRMETSCHPVVGACRIISDPVYCERDCRVIPTPETDTVPVDSQVNVKVVGLENPDDAKNLDFALGVRANDHFVQDMADPSSIDGKYAFLFQNLSPGDKSLLVLKSDDYVLVPNQNFVVLRAGFIPGDPVELDVEVQKVDNSDKHFSAIGSPVELPPLNY